MSCENKLTNLVLKNKKNSATIQCTSFFLPFFPLYIYIYIYIIKKGKERKEKGSTLLFLHYSLYCLKTRLVNLFSHDMFCCTLFSFDELIYCTLLVKALLNMLCGKDVYGVYHFVLILKSHVV